MAKRILAVGFVVVLLVLGFMNFHQVTDEVTKILKLVSQGEAVKVKDEIKAFTEAYKETFTRKYDFIDMNGLAHAALGQREMNERFKLDNGQIERSLKKVDMSKKARSIMQLDTVLVDRGIDFVYVQAPVGIDRNGREVPAGMVEYGNRNADSLVGLLRKFGVDTMDLREEIENDGLNIYDMFFTTDHHWTPDTGFWAFGKLAEKLASDYGIMIDPKVLDPEQYEREVYTDVFLGSHGKRTGRYFAGVDDMVLIKPTFDTEMTLEQPGHVSCAGSFDEVIFQRKHLEVDYFEDDPYAAYLGHVYGNIHFRNSKAQGEQKILLVHDSYSKVVIPYFALAFQELDAIDLRRYNDKTLLAYIKETNPDTVIVMYNPSMFALAELFSYGIE